VRIEVSALMKPPQASGERKPGGVGLRSLYDAGLQRPIECEVRGGLVDGCDACVVGTVSVNLNLAKLRE
jgi:hypothetical protein